MNKSNKRPLKALAAILVILAALLAGYLLLKNSRKADETPEASAPVAVVTEESPVVEEDDQEYLAEKPGEEFDESWEEAPVVRRQSRRKPSGSHSSNPVSEVVLPDAGGVAAAEIAVQTESSTTEAETTEVPSPDGSPAPVVSETLGLTGGIKARIIDRESRTPIPETLVELFQAGAKIAETKSDADGNFFFGNLPDGNFTLTTSSEGYIGARINVTVERGLVRDLRFVTLSQSMVMMNRDLDDESFSVQDLEDTGYSDSPTILFGANDPYNNVAGYGFSSVRFKNRGYNSETQDVYLAGVRMNDAITGYTPYSLWSGLNEAMRSKDSATGLNTADYGVGGFNGSTNISAMPSTVRPGWRFSALTNSAMYRLRLMANYASGQMDNGWSFAVNASARIGGNDWIDGVFYRSFAIYAGGEKKFNDAHRLGFFAFMAPGQRGAQNASTQEVYNLMGDNMYNSNWGYQNGKVRNSRVRKTYEPVVAVKYDFTPNDRLKTSATLLWRTGSNGYTALDWYDAADPRPDYYKNLPSYYSMEDEDYNRTNTEKAEWATEMWSNDDDKFRNYQHVDWDYMYNVNYNAADGRSKYAVEERHVDQNDINLALKANWRISDEWRLDGGFDGRINRTENYKKIDDLLGGQYYLNVDQFAERDYAAIEDYIQNDWDYYAANKTAQKVGKGGKYGYDYLAQIRKAGVWANGQFSKNGFTANLAGTIGYEGFWREGLVRKGMFAGLDDNGNEIRSVNDPSVVLTTYDSHGNVISSKGKSEVKNFLVGSAKLGLQYAARGHRVAFNAGYFSDAPTFNQSFVSARTRNSIVDNLKNRKTWSTDLTYQFSKSGYNLRLTAFYSQILDQSKVMSFYDDSQQSYTNFAMTGINEKHAGIEFGAKIPLPLQGLSLSGVLYWGRSVYFGTPHMVQTIDNSSEIVRDEDVAYWSSHPVFKQIQLDDGTWVYEQDCDDVYQVDHYEVHHTSSSPELAAQLSLNYRTRSYWFFEINGQYFAQTYLDMNPLYRTSFACRGSESDPGIIEYMASQEQFSPSFLMNLSVGKSWYIHRKYNLGFSVEVKNLLNNTGVRTGGYEQTRLISSAGKDRYYKFDPKYFYMPGCNYMINLYFRF